MLLTAIVPEYMFVIAVSQWNAAHRLKHSLNQLSKKPSTSSEKCKICSENLPNRSQSTEEESPSEQEQIDNHIGWPHPRVQCSEPTDVFHERPVHQADALIELEEGLSQPRQGSVNRASWANAQHSSSAAQVLPEKPENGIKAGPGFNLKQAYFIVAGGLAVEAKGFLNAKGVCESKTLTITPAGALKLAELGILEEIPDDVVDDKTKADPFTKILVCFQAGWFLVQCVARISQNLPLTLLEIHVAAHVGVALFMYLFWFSKPYNALQPFFVTQSETVEMTSLFALMKEKSRFLQYEMRQCCTRMNRQPIEDHMSIRCDQGHSLYFVERALRRLETNDQHFVYEVASGGRLYLRHAYVSNFLRDYGSSMAFDQGDYQVFPRIRIGLPSGSRSIAFWICLLFVFYGSFHLTAWNAHFPTTVERWLWRGAGLFVAAPPALILFLLAVTTFTGVSYSKKSSEEGDSSNRNPDEESESSNQNSDEENGSSNRNSDKKNDFTNRDRSQSRLLTGTLSLIFCINFTTFMTITSPLTTSIMILARPYFIVAAFISLRAPAPRQYETVEWTQFWPHW